MKSPRNLTKPILLILTVLLIYPNSALPDNAESVAIENLQRSLVVVRVPSDRNQICHTKGDPGCGGTGTAFVYGHHLIGETQRKAPAGIVLTNKHVTSGRSLVSVFVPLASALGKYTYENLSAALTKFGLDPVPLGGDGRTWHGGGIGRTSCSGVMLSLDKQRNIVWGDERLFGGVAIGTLTTGRLIAEHPTSDVAIVQVCAIGSLPIGSWVDCSTLERGEEFRSVGASLHYGLSTWLLGTFRRCNDQYIEYTMPREAGRSGSPLVKRDPRSGEWAVFGIHKRPTDRGTAMGVPIQRALELLEEIRTVKLLGIENATDLSVFYSVRCSSNQEWRTWTIIDAEKRRLLRCSYDSVKVGEIPSGFSIRFAVPESNQGMSVKKDLRYKLRYVVRPEDGGTELDWELDVVKYGFNYEVDGATVNLSL